MIAINVMVQEIVKDIHARNVTITSDTAKNVVELIMK